MHATSEIIPGFIVFESIDGAGTTTQSRLLAERMRAEGLDCRVDAEPTRGPIGLLIREALSGRMPVHAHTLAHLFAADRCEHLNGSDGIREACAAGRVVISDRYLFSSLAYQSVSCGQELPRRLNQDFALPEWLVFFQLPAERGLERLRNRQQLEIFENLDFQQRVALAYQRVLDDFAQCGMKVLHIDASADIQSIADRIWQALGYGRV